MTKQQKPFWIKGYYGLRAGKGVMICDNRPWYGRFKFVNGENIRV